MEDAVFTVRISNFPHQLQKMMIDIILAVPIPFKSKTKREDEELAAQIEQEMRAEALHNPEQQFPQYGSYPMRPPEARFNDRWAMGPEPTRLPERPDSSQAPPYGTAR